MGPIGEFTFGPFELLGWGMQILLIAAVALRLDTPIRLRSPTLSICLLVLVLGWVFRLAYLFALASGGFQYWIGDDPLRWLTAWEWMQSPEGATRGVATWMPATLYLHGSVMWLVSDPLHGSKLLSATYSLMSLAGVFVFSQAVFRHRGFSTVCVVFLAPFWIGILLSTGTMAEMPTTAAMLGGAGALISALRMAPGRRRTQLLLGAGVSFAVATMFHLVAWIQLTGILVFVLPYFLRESHGTLATRFRSWVAFCAVSTSCCFIWALDVWTTTGSPFSHFRTAAGGAITSKIGGPTKLFELVGSIATPVELAFVGLSGISLMFWIGLRLVRHARRAGVFGRFEASNLSAPSWLSAGVAALLFVLVGWQIDSWLSALPRDQYDRFILNLAVYPVSLVYCLYYYLPLAIFGMVAVLFERNQKLPHLRPVLACIAWVLVILVATALAGGANRSPFRSVLTLSAALVPFSLAPIFQLRSMPASAGARPGRAFRWLSIALSLGVLGQLVAANHTRIFSELPEPKILERVPKPTRADAYALGAWLRVELQRPGYLSRQNLAHPFELVLMKDWGGIKQTLVEYHVGDPGRFAHPGRIRQRTKSHNARVIAALVPGQVLIADYEIDDPRLRLIVQLGHFSIYEALGGTQGSVGGS